MNIMHAGVRMEHVQISTYTLQEQLELMSRATVVISSIGSRSFRLMYLPNGATMILIGPPECAPPLPAPAPVTPPMACPLPTDIPVVGCSARTQRNDPCIRCSACCLTEAGNAHTSSARQTLSHAARHHRTQ